MAEIEFPFVVLLCYLQPSQRPGIPSDDFTVQQWYQNSCLLISNIKLHLLQHFTESWFTLSVFKHTYLAYEFHMSINDNSDFADCYYERDG